MNPAPVGILIALVALVAFLIGRGRRGWWLFLAALILMILGGGGDWLIEKGPQSAFARSPVSATHLAWTFSVVAMVGLGGAVGLVVRGALELAKKR